MISGRTSTSAVKCSSPSSPSAGGQAGDLRDLDLGLAQRAQLVLADGLGVEAGQALVDGVLDDGRAADALVDDARRDLALAEAGDLTSCAMCS